VLLSDRNARIIRRWVAPDSGILPAMERISSVVGASGSEQFIGTNGISVGHGLSTPDSDEAAVKRAMVRCANYVVVVADSSKIGHEDFVSFAPINAVDTLITDTEINDADRKALIAHGVEVVLA